VVGAAVALWAGPARRRKVVVAPSTEQEVVVERIADCNDEAAAAKVGRRGASPAGLGGGQEHGVAIGGVASDAVSYCVSSSLASDSAGAHRTGTSVCPSRLVQCVGQATWIL